ncbi:hypothetical protein MPLA_2130069 [Mesorhizobium sp. ORS 3359]|nr:hypothetical protein MPLA_2130069 [Mesorhizobium sp. ORS 3359]
MLTDMPERASRAMHNRLSGASGFVVHGEKIPQTGLTGKEFVLISFSWRMRKSTRWARRPGTTCC